MSPMAGYPATLDIDRPERFSRAQLGLRVVLLLLIGFLGWTLGAFFALLYLGLPAFVAISLSEPPPGKYMDTIAPRVVAFLRRVLAAYAYVALLTDRFSLLPPGGGVRFEVRLSGKPVPSTALLRILHGLPSAVALALLAPISAVVWLVSFVAALMEERVPAVLFDFQLGFVRWMARLLAYQASLVEPYPPFSLSAAPSAPEDTAAARDAAHDEPGGPEA